MLYGRVVRPPSRGAVLYEVPDLRLPGVLPGCGTPPLGVGEAAHGPVAAAIGNALADALGLRVRTLPLTPENVVAAMPD